MSEKNVLEGLKKAVLSYDVDGAKKFAEMSVKMKIDPIKAIQEGPLEGVIELGNKFGAKEIFLPELMVGADACVAAVTILKAQIGAENKKPKSLGKVVIGTVEGDIHDIGKNLVATMLEANGFEVYNIGEDQSVDAFINKAKEVKADVIGASALTTTTRLEQGKLVKALKKSGLKTRLMIGGAVVDRAWTERIGADGYANNLVEAVDLAKQLIKAK